MGVQRIANVKPRITPILSFPRQRGKEHKINHGKNLVISYFVLLYLKVCAARANVSMRQSQEGGFQTRPYKFLFFFAYFAFLRLRSGQAFAVK